MLKDVNPYSVVDLKKIHGIMGGRVSEKFQALTKLGEDKILYDKENNIGINTGVLSYEDKDTFIGKLEDIDINKMEECASIELGNNFELGTKYSDSMKLYYQDKEGKNKPFYMGCYGIGLGRILATLIENNVILKDNLIKGFVIPYNIAPYKVHIVYNEINKENAFNLYNKLLSNGIECIIDDRENLTLGNRINDVALLGTPKLIVLGSKFDNTNYEIEDMKTNEKSLVEKEKIVNYFMKNNYL